MTELTDQPDVSQDAWKERTKRLPFSVFVIIGVMVIYFALTNLTWWAVDNGSLALPEGLPAFYPQLGVMVVLSVALLVAWKLKGGRIQDLGFGPVRPKGDVLFTIAALVVLGAVYGAFCVGVWVYAQQQPDPGGWLRHFVHRSTFSDYSIAYVVGIAVLFPVLEEFWYRGFLYTGLRGDFGRWGALLFSALIFAFAHSNHLPVNQFFGGIVFGLVYAYRRNLYAGILLHMAGNGSLALIGWAVRNTEWFEPLFR